MPFVRLCTITSLTPAVFAVWQRTLQACRGPASLENVESDQFRVEAGMLWNSCSGSLSGRHIPGLKIGFMGRPVSCKTQLQHLEGPREAFLASYPSELLSPEETPRARLMALTCRGVAGKSLKWPQWKHRLCVARASPSGVQAIKNATSREFALR